MDTSIGETNQRNLTGSLEHCKEQLRDAYMNFKDLQNRTVIDFKNAAGKGEEDHTVYYFKPETFLLDDPEKQRQYRDSLLKKIGGIPKPEPISYLGDELHRSMCQSVADRSSAKAIKEMLCEFFKRRQYSLQHMKYRLLCRWAHFNLTSESIETLTPEATFLYGKLDFNLEQAMLRSERLEHDDYYDFTTQESRPSTKTENGTSMYVEKFDLAPQSLIREDDIEVYIRGVSHRNKINKLVNKFMSRLKWLPMKQKYEIFENSITEYFNLKNQNIERQNQILQTLQLKSKTANAANPEVLVALEAQFEGYYCKLYEKMFSSCVDKTLHFWKGNHDEPPRLVSDIYLLKYKILEACKGIQINGDIEVDQGYSFSYQVSVVFPTIFQGQILKSQFSIYDEIAGDDDPNIAQKRTLSQMARVDTNIFRDLSTTKGSVPSDEALQSELRNMDLKIMRLRSAAFWIEYVALTPSEPEWHQKQQALLNNDNPIDSLLKSGFNFLDVNDLASVNRINEDNAQLHIQNVIKLSKHNPHETLVRKTTTSASENGNKFVVIDTKPLQNFNNNTGNIEAHLLSAVQDEKVDETNNSLKADNLFKGNSLNNLPSHLVTTYNTLRFIKSRDSKIRILYTLNYFRSVQKRIALDLREFATRDRLDGNQINPFIQSKEASQHVVNQASFATKTFDKLNTKNNSDFTSIHQKNFTIFDENAISQIKNMASLRNYKCNGLFSNKIFSTCPSFPKFHSSHGEPLVRQTIDEEMDRQGNFSISERSIRLMGRIEFVEINDVLQEVYIKDDFGIYIMHDCALQDMKSIEDELCKIGSYFLHKGELLLDPTKQVKGMRPLPEKDRLELINDLLIKEADFQFQKVKLIQVYMECYEHVTDPLEQQKLMQIITDIMARRPRLNMNANYFIDAYDAEIKCIKKQFELVKYIVDFQITLEKTENKRLQDSLSLSYQLANQYVQNKWYYFDSDTLLSIIQKKRKNNQQHKRQDENSSQTSVQNQFQNGVMKGEQQSTGGSLTDDQNRNDSHEAINRDIELQSKVSNKTTSQVLNDNISDCGSQSEKEYGKDEENQFTKLLGLPQITLETIYQSYKEKDIDVLKLMSEHSHFIAVHEGYPEFLTRLPHKSIRQEFKNFKPNSWSQETGTLDFYETLDFITKFYSITQQMQQELYDGLKMWDTSLMTQIDIQVAEMSILEFRRIIQFMDGSEVEYEGRAFVEDEQIMGSSDKQIFYAKEMLADLGFKPKKLLDPFLMAKLDLSSINYFDFPKIPEDLNKYTLRNKGVSGFDYLIDQEKQSIAGIAKGKVDHGNQNQNYEDIMKGNVQDILNARNIVVPSLLKTYCNMIELHRLRNEIILAASETMILQQIYLSQCESVGLKQVKIMSAEGISFDQIDNLNDSKLVNFIDHGCAHMCNIELAIKEFDPNLLSNFNFRNPDAFKLNILTSGLEEVRAILQYQILQKHLLIVATRSNSLLIDTHLRAASELILLDKKMIAIPNSIIRYNKLMNRNFDTINYGNIKNERISYNQNLTSTCQPVFYTIISKKNQTRTSIAKEYSNYQTIVSQAMPLYDYSVLRVMRCFKLKLLTRFVQNTLIEVYLDAQKVQAVHTCQRLRYFNRYFMFDPKVLNMSGNEVPQVLKYETSNLIENFPNNYFPQQFDQQEKQDITSSKIQQQEIYKFINQSSFEITDYSGIPSSSTLMNINASPIEDIRSFRKKRLDLRIKQFGQIAEKEDLKEIDPKQEEPEKHLKFLLPTFTPEADLETNLSGCKKSQEEIDVIIKNKIGQSAGNLLDYEEALYFGDSKYAQLIRFYLSLDRILTIEWFIQKLQFRSDEVICIDNAIYCGQQFWGLDEFDARITSVIPQIEKPQQINFRAQSYFCNQILSQRQKRNIAESVHSLALTVKSFINQVNKTPIDKRFDYMSSYIEFRYQQVIGSMHKLVQQFYTQKNISAVKVLQSSLAQITKMNHVKIMYLKPNNYTVNACVVASEIQILEPGNFIYGSVQHDEVINFRRCVQPIINEKALEPPQVTLFQTLYNHDNIRRNFSSQFAGQLCSNSNSESLKELNYALLNLNAQERLYSQSFIVQAKYQANDFMETVFNDTAMANLTTEEVYNLRQLVDAKKFINESTQALLLRNSLICWFENSPLPDTIEQYEQFDQNFRQNFFWKQMEMKEEMTKKLNMMNTFGSIPSNKDLKEMRQKIDNLVNDHSLATQSQFQQRDALVKALREEFASLKKKVTLDAYFSTKAEIAVFSNEIEKFIIEASVKTLDSECNALAKCFTIQVPKIQYHIHPFQQFAATFFDQMDPHSHLDVANKINSIQVLLTRMRNRCAQIETLTSGPGMVFTIKDLNDILLEFCKMTIKDQEKQFKSRQETSSLQEKHLKNLIYIKDQRIKSIENRLNRVGLNLENIIDARLFEKGNQLIYELDSSNRILKIFKNAIYDLERSLLSKIHGEQLEKFSRKNNELSLKDVRYDKYKQTILNMINADFAEDQERIKKIIKQKADNAKITDKEMVYQKVTLYPEIAQNNGKQDINNTGGILSGGIVPKGFEHYSFCSCYKPNPNFPRPTLELAELEMLSESEARRELTNMCTILRRQRILWLTKDMCTRSKYQDQINQLKKQLSNNAYLWDQLAESEKRERVLKQELLYTQSSLSSAEKTILNLKEDLKGIDAERSRLLNFKNSRAEKFKELEIRVNKIDLFENIDTDKLVGALSKQDAQLQAVKGIQQTFQSRMLQQERRSDQIKRNLEQKFYKEQAKTQQVIEKMEQMKLELKMLETNDSSVASIWKKKCLDLFEVCQAMKTENEELRGRCKELIHQGIELAETLENVEENQNQLRVSNNTQQIPKLATYYTGESLLNSNTIGGGPSSPGNQVRDQLFLSLNTNQRSSQGTRGVKQLVTPQPSILPDQQFQKYQRFNQDLKLPSDKQIMPLIGGLNQIQQVPITQQNQRVRNGDLSTLDGKQEQSTKHTTMQVIRVPAANDIRSILSNDSHNYSRHDQRRIASSNTDKAQGSFQINNGVASKRRQNYINQLLPQQQDSIFNQSQGTTLHGYPLQQQIRNATTADANVLKESLKLRKPAHLLSFDLQGKSLINQQATLSPKQHERKQSQGAQLSTQKSLNLNVQKLQVVQQQKNPSMIQEQVN